MINLKIVFDLITLSARLVERYDLNRHVNGLNMKLYSTQKVFGRFTFCRFILA